MPAAGALLCLASAVAFGAMAIFGKLAYDDGATVGTLLSVRFVLAAALFWALVRRSGAARHLRASPAATSAPRSRSAASATAPRPARTSPRCDRLDASLLSLLLYTFPAMVTVAAIALGRERGEPARGGRARALVGRPRARAGRCRLGVARSRRARCSASRPRSSTPPTSSAAAGIAGRVDPLVLSALVCTGAATTLTLGSGRARRPASGGAEPGRLRLARRHRGRLDGRRRHALLRGPAPRRARPRPRSSRRRSR